jgi:hypothetical protein
MTGNKRPPTHNLKVLRKSDHNGGLIGLGWQKPDGSIGIRLFPCVVLRDDPDLVFTLFPRDKDDTNDAQTEDGG